MAAWKYIKGSEKDFLGAPTNTTYKLMNNAGLLSYADSREGPSIRGNLEDMTIIAQRERVTSINDGRLAQDMGLNPKYNRPCKSVTIDVYDVLQAFNVTNPALQHLVKKALAVGQRGHKDKMEDLRDILASAQRAIELEESDE